MHIFLNLVFVVFNTCIFAYASCKLNSAFELFKSTINHGRSVMGFINESSKYAVVEQLNVWSEPCITKNGVKIHGAAALSKNAHEAMKEVLREIKLTQSVTGFYDSCLTALTSH